MAAYQLILAASAERILGRLPEAAVSAIVDFMTGPLLEEPVRAGKPLMFELEKYRGARRGPYRIAYRVDEEARTV